MNHENPVGWNRETRAFRVPFSKESSGIGYPIKAERLYEELYKKTKRWTYKGKPTKKARKLQILEQRMEGLLDAYDALVKA